MIDLNGKTMTRVPTRPDLQALLDLARKAPPMTEADITAQRESWVRGEMGIGLDADEAAWREANMKSRSPSEVFPAFFEVTSGNAAKRDTDTATPDTAEEAS